MNAQGGKQKRRCSIRSIMGMFIRQLNLLQLEYRGHFCLVSTDAVVARLRTDSRTAKAPLPSHLISPLRSCLRGDASGSEKRYPNMPPSLAIQTEPIRTMQDCC